MKVSFIKTKAERSNLNNSRNRKKWNKPNHEERTDQEPGRQGNAEHGTQGEGRDEHRSNTVRPGDKQDTQ